MSIGIVYGAKYVWRNGMPEMVREATVTSQRNRPPHGQRGSAPLPWMLADMAYRAGDPCAYCGFPSEHWDHMESRHRGGPNHPDNLIRACRSCNVSKRTRSPLQYLAARATVEPA